jgi:methylaspartate ammonia-lyase
MPRIVEVLAVPAAGAGYYEDLAALQADHVPLPRRFTAPPRTSGFRAIREVAQGVSVGLVLDTGQVAWGDCVAVSYSGAWGRRPVFRTDEGLATIREVVVPTLEGRELTTFGELAAEIGALAPPVEAAEPPAEPDVPDPSRRALFTAPTRLLRGDLHPDSQLDQSASSHLHPAIPYGVTQALLQAVALARNCTMAEVICQEWDLPKPGAASRAERVGPSPIPIHAQSGHERYYHAEKMIVRRIASLPHGLVDNVSAQVGQDGSEMTRYIRWLAKRIGELGGADYRPTIHLDLYGALGEISDHQPGRMLGQLYAWESAARPYPLRVESPVLMDSREAQIEAMKTLREYVRFRKMNVQLVADEWANTLADVHAFVDAEAADIIQIKMPDLGSVHNAVEAALVCKAAEIGVFIGGSYAETDLSARVSVHVAVAAGADLLMAKPGTGVDEAVSLVQNEMARTLAMIRMREG